MSGADTMRYKAQQFIQSLPGKRGKDIPADDYDRIYNAASGITQQIWGRPPSPVQMQWLHDNGAVTPDKVREAYDGLEHPYASGLTVGEYAQHSDAYDTYKQHR